MYGIDGEGGDDKPDPVEPENWVLLWLLVNDEDVLLPVRECPVRLTTHGYRAYWNEGVFR